ncbi:pyrroline-5-carboxylate reductase [Formicincola oecophyllae]|uniref:Pyrroline-5-carboxylate reductase n=1 Tax=Formicincola oecophyllae TaxID=2558361 RepID=A0A4Y6U807_9PROT|nr:pyrroline-5-carboxylate reductase [Formicincola oecophyllae]QDH13482.1 pyrroline-5-carboxylate reductase [Formicincola oecophyllae]
MTSSPNTILLAGCGHMGSALLHGWLKSKLPLRLYVLDRHYQPPAGAPVTVWRTLADIPEDFRPDMVVLAVKPKGADAFLEALHERLGRGLSHATLLSVAAGRSCANLAKASGGMAVVRAMPNTPAAIGAGTTGLYSAPDVPPARAALAAQLMKAVGAVVEVPHENDLAAVTAISGSGPAYVFLLAELLEKAGQHLGLNAETAKLLARNTVYGAGEMLHEDPLSAEQLRRNVTSPGGTTEAALKVFMAPDAWPATVERATEAAAHRADELSQ